MSGDSDALDNVRKEQLRLNDSNSSFNSDVVWYLLLNLVAKANVRQRVSVNFNII